MKNKLLRSAFLVGLTAASATAMAATPSSFYLGAQLGYGKAHYDSSSKMFQSAPVMTSATVSNGGLGGRVLAGYLFNENWAAEVGFAQFKNTQFTNVVTTGGARASGKVKQQVWDVVGKGIYPLDNGMDVYAKAGAAYVRATTTDGLAIYNNINKWRPEVGLGASYSFNPNVSADVSYTTILKGSGIERSDLGLVGLTYHFA